MPLFLDLCVQGIAGGAWYAIIGVSFGLIFNVTKVFHFAYGAVFSLGAYTIYFLVATLQVPLPAAILAAALVSGAAGMACELLLYRPLRRRGASSLLLFLASFALLIILENLMFMAFGGVPLSLAAGSFGIERIGTVAISRLALWKIAVGILVVALMFSALKYTRIGRELRAVVSHPEMARVVGIDLDAAYLRAYAIGSAAMIPAAAIALFDQGVTPVLGESTLLAATVAVFAGGVGALMGGALGGLVLALISSLSVFWFPATLQQTIALAAMTLFLLWRPSGLLGIRMRRV